MTFIGVLRMYIQVAALACVRYLPWSNDSHLSILVGQNLIFASHFTLLRAIFAVALLLKFEALDILYSYLYYFYTRYGMDANMDVRHTLKGHVHVF